MRWDGMGWDGMGWDGMGWDGMGWDEMEWDEIIKTYTLSQKLNVPSDPAVAKVPKLTKSKIIKELLILGVGSVEEK